MFKIRVDEVKRSLLAGGSSDEIKTQSTQGHSQLSHQRSVELRKTKIFWFQCCNNILVFILPTQFQLLQECLRKKCHILKCAHTEVRFLEANRKLERSLLFSDKDTTGLMGRGRAPLCNSHPQFPLERPAQCVCTGFVVVL